MALGAACGLLALPAAAAAAGPPNDDFANVTVFAPVLAGDAIVGTARNDVRTGAARRDIVFGLAPGA